MGCPPGWRQHVREEVTAAGRRTDHGAGLPRCPVWACDLRRCGSGNRAGSALCPVRPRRGGFPVFQRCLCSLDLLRVSLKLGASSVWIGRCQSTVPLTPIASSAPSISGARAAARRARTCTGTRTACHHPDRPSPAARRRRRRPQPEPGSKAPTTMHSLFRPRPERVSGDL